MIDTLWAWLERVSSLWIGPAGAALVGSAAVIIVIACATQLLRRKSAALCHALWMIVLLRLLVPPQVGLPIHLGRLADVARDTAARWFARWPDSASGPNGNQQVGLFRAHDSVRGDDDASILLGHEPDALTLASGLIFATWLSGVVFFAVATAWRLSRLRRSLCIRNVLPDEPLQVLFEQCRRRLGVTHRCSLHLSSNHAGPCVIGVFHPAVILPADLPARMRRCELEPLLLHELAHLRRRDTAVIWLQYLAQILHWPNPLVWMANRRIRQVREQACDDIVLAATRYRPRDYGAALIKVLELGDDRVAPATGLLGVAEPYGIMRHRLRRIMDAHRPGSMRLSFSARIMTVLAGLAMLSVAPTLAAGDPASRDATTGTLPLTHAAPETAGATSVPEALDGSPSGEPSTISPRERARILAARQECFPDEVCERLLALQGESSRKLDPSGRLSVNMLARSIDHDLNLWTGVVSRGRRAGQAFAGEIKLANTSATDPLLILTDGGVVLPHRLARWKAEGPGEYELFVTLDRPWLAGQEKTFYWVVPSGRPRSERANEHTFVLRNVKGSEGIQLLMLVLPPDFRVTTTSEPPVTRVRIGGRVILLWQKHVQTDEDYRVTVALERSGN